MFRVSPVMTASISLRILLSGILRENCELPIMSPARQFREKCRKREITGDKRRFRHYTDDRPNYVSSQPRYDHFDISAYFYIMHVNVPNHVHNIISHPARFCNTFFKIYRIFSAYRTRFAIASRKSFSSIRLIAPITRTFMSSARPRIFADDASPQYARSSGSKNAVAASAHFA